MGESISRTGGLSPGSWINLLGASTHTDNTRSENIRIIMVTTLSTGEGRSVMSLKQRLEGGSSEEQLTCFSIPSMSRRSGRVISNKRSNRTSISSSTTSSSSINSRSGARVNIIFPDGQQHFASLLRLYLERRGASVSLMGEGLVGGRCSRHLVLLPVNENQRNGLGTWLSEVARAASRRSSNLVAVVEERGEWRKTDPWLHKLPVIKESVLWVHDYQEACVQRIAEMLRLDEEVLEEEEEEEDIAEELDITEEEEDITTPENICSKSETRGGQELWGTIRRTFLRKRTISEDSGYSSS